MSWMTKEQRLRILDLLDAGEMRTKVIQQVIYQEFGRLFRPETINRFLTNIGVSRRRQFPAEVRNDFIRLCADNPGADTHTLLDLYESATGYRVPLEMGHSWKHAAKRNVAARGVTK